VEAPVAAAAIRERPPKLELVGQHRVTRPRGGPSAAPTTGLPGATCELSARWRLVAGRSPGCGTEPPMAAARLHSLLFKNRCLTSKCSRQAEEPRPPSGRNLPCGR